MNSLPSELSDMEEKYRCWVRGVVSQPGRPVEEVPRSGGVGRHSLQQ